MTETSSIWIDCKKCGSAHKNDRSCGEVSEQLSVQEAQERALAEQPIANLFTGFGD